ncbi:MAG: AMP-binding protein [Desulfomonilaceae bacterium]|nr:AMP-binding protein [Desulfomonilaceae bacterium]
MSVYDGKIWLRSYKLGPFELASTMAPYPKVPVFTFLDAAVAKFARRPACLYRDRAMTYKELGGLVNRLASGLRSIGVEPGDRVATILNTSPQYVISDFAIQKAGAVHVPCSPLHRCHDLALEIGASGAETLICLDDNLSEVMSHDFSAGLRNIITTSADDFSAMESETVSRPGRLNLRDLIEQADPTPPTVDIDPEEDLALLVFTGGATGRPKGVMLTHYNLVANTIQALPWAIGPLRNGIIGKSSVLIGIPVFHSYGHWAIRAAVYWGLQMIMIPDPRDTPGIAALLKAHRPFMAPLVPTQYMKLLEHGVGRTNTTFTSGAAPLPPELAAQFRKMTGMPITEAYGLTETSPVTHFNLSSFSKITGFMPSEKKASIGVPVADTEARLVDPVVGSEVPVGEVGELYIRGPQVMKGYWPTPGRGLANGWLPTGDLCRMDSEGYFYLVDRDKDMINVSGNKVYSTRVDEVIFEHPGVAQAVSIGIPDGDRPGSERVKAFVVVKESYAGKLTEEELIAHCSERLAPYAVPKTIEFRAGLPMTVTQKLFKKQLRDEEIERSKRR